jgi:hypothetical protein
VVEKALIEIALDLCQQERSCVTDRGQLKTVILVRDSLKQAPGHGNYATNGREHLVVAA